MALVSDEAFVIATWKWKESSLIARCFTRDHGKLGVTARGVRRPKSRIGSALETFSRLKIIFYLRSGADLASLKEAEAVDHYPALRSDLTRFAAASLYFEILDRGIGIHEKHEALFHLTARFLESLEREKRFLNFTPPFFLELISGLGFAPRVDTCRECGTEKGLAFFDPAKGRSVCSRCATRSTNTIPLPEELRREILSTYTKTEEKPNLLPWPGKTLKPFYQLIHRLVEYHFETGLKSADFFFQQIG